VLIVVTPEIIPDCDNWYFYEINSFYEHIKIQNPGPRSLGGFLFKEDPSGSTFYASINFK
jgi:hypothetical protein